MSKNFERNMFSTSKRALEANTQNLKNKGIFEYNHRFLQEIFDDESDVPFLKKLYFPKSIFETLVKFISTKYIKQSDNITVKRQLTMLIENSLKDIEESVNYFLEKTFDELTYNSDITSIKEVLLQSIKIIEIPNISDIRSFEAGEMYFMLVNESDMEIKIIQLVCNNKPINSPFISINNQFIDVCKLLMSLLFKSNTYKYDYVLPFSPIESKIFPEFYSNDNDSIDIVDSIAKTISNGKRKFCAVLTSSALNDALNKIVKYTYRDTNKISDLNIDKIPENAHIDKLFKKIFGNHIEIFKYSGYTPYFNLNQLENEFFTFLNSYVNEVKTKPKVINEIINQKEKYPIILNLEKLQLDPGVVIETPFISYESIINLIHKECYNANYKTTKVFGPTTKSIFISLYRVQEKGEIMESLIHAAKHGIFVFVYVEPNAKGNEKANIAIIKRLKKAGVRVVKSYQNLKVHAKAFLSIRSDGSMIAHISSGNYDEKRAKIFTDYQFITTNIEICEDLMKFFLMIMLSQPLMTKYEDFYNSNLTIAPLNMETTIIDLISSTIGSINIKCNSLGGSQITKLLQIQSIQDAYVRCIVRSTCELVESGNIQIRSNTSKFVEHGRLYQFGNNVFISSADLFTNMTKKVDLMVKLPDDVCIISKYGADSLQDNIQSYMKLGMNVYACLNPERLTTVLNEDYKTAISGERFTSDYFEYPMNYFNRIFKEAKWKKSSDQWEKK